MLSVSPDFSAVSKGAVHLRRSQAQSAAKVTKVAITSGSDHNLTCAERIALDKPSYANTT